MFKEIGIEIEMEKVVLDKGARSLYTILRALPQFVVHFNLIHPFPAVLNDFLNRRAERALE